MSANEPADGGGSPHERSASGEKPITVYGAMAANVVIAIAKFVAAFFTGSSSMLSEGIHSLVDTGNSMLLLLGVARSRKPPDELHPFGYGPELYFWSLVVALLLFSIGGGLSLFEGVQHIRHPEEIQDAVWSFAVLGVAFLAEGTSWVIAVRSLLEKRKPGDSLLTTFRKSKDPSVFVVVAEDSAALLGLVAAFAGVALAITLDMPVLDGVASIVIAIILIAVASLLVYESRALVMGETADSDLVRSVREIARREPGVAGVNRLLTMQLSPRHVLLNMDLQFQPDISGGALFSAIESTERRIREAHPEVRSIFVEVEAVRQSRGAAAQPA